MYLILFDFYLVLANYCSYMSLFILSGSSSGSFTKNRCDSFYEDTNEVKFYFNEVNHLIYYKCLQMMYDKTFSLKKLKGTNNN